MTTEPRQFANVTSSRLRVVPVALVVGLSLLCLAAIAAAGAGTAQSVAAQNGTAEPDVDTTVTRIGVAENGSARWRIEIRTRLDDAGTVEQYEAYQERFRANRSAYLDSFSRRMSATVDDAEAVTGREMNATAFDAETSIQELPRRWGVVTYSFTWTNFAASDGEAVVVGDTFEGGFYLSDDDSLIVESPPGYAVETISPEPDRRDGEDSEWSDRRDFEDGEPSVRFVPATQGEDPGSERVDAEEGAGLPVGTIGATLLALAVAGIGGILWRRDRSNDSVDGATTSSGDSSDDSNEVAAASSEGATMTSSEDATTAPSDGGTAPSNGDDPAASQPAGASPRAADADERDADGVILTDEDRVRQLLAGHDGRIKQQRIADEFDWSASKTSRVLSRMADEGTVEKLRIGRENVIDLLEE